MTGWDGARTKTCGGAITSPTCERRCTPFAERFALLVRCVRFAYLGFAGSPSTRSPSRLRWIWWVPPAMVACRVTLSRVARDVAVADRRFPRQPGHADQVAHQFGARLLERARGELHHRSGRRVAPGEHALLVAVASPLEDPLRADHAQSLAHDGVAARPATSAALSNCRRRRPPPDPPMYPDRSPPSVPCETPNRVDLAEHGAGVQSDAFEEHLVEVAAAGDVDQRSYGDACGGHRQDEHRDAGVGLGRVRIGPRQQQPELGIGWRTTTRPSARRRPTRRRRGPHACGATRGPNRRRARRTAGTTVRRRRSAAAGSAASVPRSRRRGSWPRRGACRCRADGATERRNDASSASTTLA